jgi:ABC-type polysaccharide/polyol phosphate export permease
MIGGVKSVTAGQRLILNTAFPRIMLPMSAALVSLIRFLPTMAVFLMIKAVFGLPFTLQMLWAIPIVAIAFLLALGLAILFSCINVYFRDIATFLPYFNRSWLYLSPILYEASALKPKLRPLEHVNPLFPLLDSWSRVMVHGEAPKFSELGVSLLWAIGFLLVGTYFFLSREREFAVRV